jgi:hypothetical protein
MNRQQLVSLGPMLVTIGAMSYATYALQPVIPGSAAGAGGPSIKESTIGRSRSMPAALATRGKPASAGRPARDPFEIKAPPHGAEAGAAPVHTEPVSIAKDPNVEFVRGLTLNATFIQGRAQMAVIDGYIYEQGQPLVGADDRPCPLVLSQVLPTSAFLRQGERTYQLGYPDVLEPTSKPGPKARPASQQSADRSRSRRPADRRLASPGPGTASRPARVTRKDSS